MKYHVTAQRLSIALVNNNMSARELSVRSGVSESSVSHYVNGSHEPSNISANKMSKVLGVDPLWLLGYDVPMIKGAQSPKPSEPLSETERYVIKFRDAMNKVDENQRKLIIDGMENMYKMLGINTDANENT